MPQCGIDMLCLDGARHRACGQGVRTVPSLRQALLPAALLLLSAISSTSASGTDATWSIAAWADLQPVGSEAELVAAVRNASCVGARLTDNIRLTAGGWPAAPIVRASNFTVDGANQSYILDMSFIESKITIAPGVAFMFNQIEIRNTRQRSGFEADIFSASPGSWLVYDHVIYHCFACLPLSLLYGIMQTLPPAGLPQNITMLLPPPGVNSSSNSTVTGGTPAASLDAWRRTWCRQRPAALAQCYSGAQVLDIHTGSLELAVSGLSGVASGGGYALLADDVQFVCEDPSTEECGNSQGYDYCVRTKIQDIYSRDVTWAKLAAAAAAQNASSRGGSGGGSSTGAVVGAAVGAAVGGCLLLAAIGALVVFLRRRRQQRHQQQPDAKAPGDAAAVTARGPNGHAPAATGTAGGGGGDDVNGAAANGVGRDGAVGDGGGSGALQQVVVLNGVSGADNGGAVSSGSGAPATAAAAGLAAGAVAAAAAPGGSSGLVDGNSTSLGLTASGTNTSSTAGGALVTAPGASNGTRADRALAAPQTAAGADPSSALLPMPPLPAAAPAVAMGTKGAGLPRSGSSNANGRGAGGGSGEGAGGAVSASLQLQQQGAAAAAAAAATGTGSVVVAGISIDLNTTLGTGSFGKVFHGSWQGRPAAVKVLQYGIDLQRAVHNEVLLSQTLSHPNLVGSLYFAQVLPGGRLGLTATASAAAATAATSHCAPPSLMASPASAAVSAGTGTPPANGRGGAGASAGAAGGGGARSSGSGGVPAAASAAAAAAAAAGRSANLNVVRISSGPSSAVAHGSSGKRLLQHRNSNQSQLQLQPQERAQQQQQQQAGGGAGRRGSGAAGAPQLARRSEPSSVHASARLGAQTAAAAAEAAAAVVEAAVGGLLGAEAPPLARTSAPTPGGGRGPGGQQSAPGLDQLGWADLDQEEEEGQEAGGQGQSGGYEHSSGGASGTQDVLSRWAEQRRRQEAMEEQGGGGAALLVAAGGTEVTPNGYVVAPMAAVPEQAAAAASGGMADVAAAADRLASGEASNVAPGAPASAALPAFPSDATTAVGGGDTATAAYADMPPPPLMSTDPAVAAQPRRPPAPKPGATGAARTGATATNAVAAGGGGATALPLEALWLAAHTQPAAGSSHGFLVMELCDGGSAFAWRAGHWRLPEDRPDLAVLLRLALDVAYGMAYVHSLGVCHGDLKLSNVLLARQQHPQHLSTSVSGLASGTGSNGNSGAGGSRAGRVGPRGNGNSGASAAAAAAALEEAPNDRLAGWTAKICDFGLARVLTGERTHVSTRPYGTPTHMAPELWTKGHVSQPADVYAYGILLWELATGERPYKGLNAARILHRVLLSGGRPALPLWLPPSYTRLASQCWAQSPKERPTFPDIVRHLEAMLAVLAAVTPQA